MFPAYIQYQILLSFNFRGSCLFWLVCLSFPAPLSIVGVRFFCCEVLLNTSPLCSHLMLTSAAFVCLTETCRTKASLLAFHGDFGNLATGNNYQKPAHVGSWGREMRGMGQNVSKRETISPVLEIN